MKAFLQNKENINVKKKKGFLSSLLVGMLLCFTILLSLFPIVWVILSSFKTNAAILSDPFSLPTSFSLEPYSYIFSKYDFIGYFLNSTLVSLSATLLALLIYAMGAYVFAKYNFPGKNLLFILYSITLLVPAQSKAQPIFSLLIHLNLYDSLPGLSLVYISMGLAMSIFVLRPAFLAIPKSLDEAAILEGADFFTVFWKINLPLAKGGLTTAGILLFLGNWNEYFYASLLISSDNARTLPLALQFFTESFSYNYPRLFAALTVVVLPGILLYAVMEEQVQTAMASSGIKG